MVKNILSKLKNDLYRTVVVIALFCVVLLAIVFWLSIRLFIIGFLIFAFSVFVFLFLNLIDKLLKYLAEKCGD